MIWAKASLDKTLEVRESITSLENPDEFRVAGAPREGTAELMGRGKCEEAGGGKQKGVQTILRASNSLSGLLMTLNPAGIWGGLSLEGQLIGCQRGYPGKFLSQVLRQSFVGKPGSVITLKAHKRQMVWGLHEEGLESSVMPGPRALSYPLLRVQ